MSGGEGKAEMSDATEVRDLMIAAARGLVVIDPDDEQKIKRFTALHNEAWDRVKRQHPDRVGTPTWEIHAEQFRMLLDPGAFRLAEPEGFGALVEDADGNFWTRLNDTHWHSESSPNNRQTWGEIDPVQVLFEGVTRTQDQP